MKKIETLDRANCSMIAAKEAESFKGKAAAITVYKGELTIDNSS